MSLETSCPYCNTRHTLDDRWAGKKIRCRDCQQPFAAPGEPARKARPAAPGRSAAASRPIGPRSDEPRADRDPSPRAANKSQWLRVLGWSGGGLLAVAGLFFLIFLLTPSEVDNKLNDLKASAPDQRAQALVWLADADPEAGYRARVTAALEPLVFEGDVHGDLNADLVLRAYLRWADRRNVPALIRMMENPTLPSWGPRQTGLVMAALGKLQDRRAIGVLAERLPDSLLHDQAVNALKLMGPGAEKTVLDYLFDPDPDTRLRASQLLADYGTNPETIAAEALSRLKSNQAEVQSGAAVWFAENPPGDETQRAEAARLLARLLDDLSPKVNAQALRALKLWATRDSLPQLLAFARRQDQAAAGDPALIEVLAQFPDETAAEAIARQLKNAPQRSKAAQALMKLGPVATKAVLGYIDDPDDAVQKEARQLSQLLNIPADRQLGQILADVADPEIPRSRAALDYLAKLRPDPASRGKVSPALNAPLLDADPGIRAAALNAVKVWGSKENTATLVKALGSFPSGPPECNDGIIEVLGALQDPAAAPALAQGLTHVRERDTVSKALRSIGASAEGAVAPFLQSDDGWARVEACRILAEVGTSKSLQPLKDAVNANSLDFFFVKEARLASQKITART
jgi:HEAT repeat protein